MLTVDRRKEDLLSTIASAQAELDLLTGQGGAVETFIKQSIADGSLPGVLNVVDVATVVSLWEKFKAAKSVKT